MPKGESTQRNAGEVPDWQIETTPEGEGMLPDARWPLKVWQFTTRIAWFQWLRDELEQWEEERRRLRGAASSVDRFVATFIYWAVSVGLVLLVVIGLVVSIWCGFCI